MGLEISLPRRRDDEIQAICDSTKRSIIKTGTYIGNGLDNRNIDIGVDLAAKSNAFLIIKNMGSSTQNEAVGRTEYGQGDLSFPFESLIATVNLIQSFTSTGFQIGDQVRVNEADEPYAYIAFWEEP